jgi:DNA-binding IclR family transcriptional regulator
MASYDNQSLARGFKILDCLSASDGPLSVAEVGRRTGLHRATAHRILTVLLQLGYVHKDPSNAMYSTAFYLHAFGHVDHILTAIRRHAAPYLRQLSYALGGQCVLLGCLEGPQVAMCDVVPATTEGLAKDEAAYRIGMRCDAHATAIGKVLMAYRPADEIRLRYENYAMASHGPRTIRSPAELLLQLKEIRQRGFATEDDESAAGIRAIAAAIVNPAGRAICAISVRGAKSRLPAERLEQHVRQVQVTAQQIADYMVHSDQALDKPLKRAAGRS